MVVHTPNVFGDQLYRYVRRAKIVLNLRSFGHAQEFKMSRLMVMLANQAFVLSETMGVDADTGPFRDGIVMVHADHLPEAVRYYLDRPALRASIAAAGHAAFLRRPQADLLRPAVNDILERVGCPLS